MKRLLIILLLCSNVCIAQYKYKHVYREAPKTGEKVMIAGILLYAASSYAVGHQTKLMKVGEKASYGLMAAGVTITIKSKDHRRKKR